MAIGDPVDSRTAPPPKLSKDEQAERIQRAKALSAQFEKLGLATKGVRRTKTGWSTEAETLEQLDHPIIPPIMDHRELSKLKGTYLDALPPLVWAKTGRLHTTFNQVVAEMQQSLRLVVVPMICGVADSFLATLVAGTPASSNWLMPRARWASVRSAR